MDHPILNIGSFCSGVGWLDVAARLALEHHGLRARSVFASEWDAYAAEVLRSRMEDSSLEPCPIWCGDLQEFPASDFRGVVDAAVFGFPCTDISCAGKRQGLEGTRSGLFLDIMRHVREMGCWLLFLENVAAITSLGLDTVLGELAESGFDAEWMCFKASDVGASHRRDRWFCVGVRRELADTPQRGLGVGGQSSAGDVQSDGSVQVVGDTRSERLQRLVETGPAARTIGRADGIFAPGPSDQRWPDILRDYPYLAPAVKSGFLQLVDGCSVVADADRSDQLRCVGNGVVVAQATLAYAKLLERFK